MAPTSAPAPAGDNGEQADAPSITSLLKRLGNETGDLVRAEVALAKVEFRELARQAALDAVKVGAAGALALVGAMALVASAVLGLGDILGGRYAVAALVVGLVLLVVGGLLARSGIRSMTRASGPGSALTSLREDRQWAAGELREFRKELQQGGARAERAVRGNT
ncbi:MAG: hypothetical protein FIB01_02175 [Gemmatimonadetes bacterium]|nr:hypothetical protein [Gemmatimonadota bacterium]